MTASVSSRRRRREELRDFLRTRRARLSPADVGLPEDGPRRTPGLRRAEVAALAGVGASWYTWLEQGRDIGVSDSVLNAVSRALRLDEAERLHLYRLAGLNPPLPLVDTDPQELRQLRRVVHEWLPSPAYVIDRYWHVLAANVTARELFGFTGPDANCLVTFFTSAARHRRFPEHAAVAKSVVAHYRADFARYPDDRQFEHIVRSLRAKDEDFARLWAQHEVDAGSLGAKHVWHPEAGHLMLDHVVLSLTGSADHRLVLHTAAAGTDGLRRLQALAGAGELDPTG